MGVKVGISPIAWQNDDLPDLTAACTMEQALKEARADVTRKVRADKKASSTPSSQGPSQCPAIPKA
jgi:hypothetical protein